MAKLVLSKGGAILYQCFLDKDRVGIGRDGHNHVVVDDPFVAGEHAEIIPIGNDHILEDLRTPSGTFVNGNRVDRHILQHGDVIELGSFYLRYLNPRVSSAIDLERTMLIDGLYGAADYAGKGAGPPAAETRVPPARPGKVRFPKGRIKVLSGTRLGSVIELDRVVAMLGKRGDRLAVLTRRPQGYFITHVEGRRYPRVNGQSVGKDARALQNADIIEVADEKVQFLIE
jgi:pSer/pThr/pTyr-binding forkhead associated (FHA) protein